MTTLKPLLPIGTSLGSGGELSVLHKRVLEVPGEQLLDPIDRMLGDALEDVTQISLWIQADELSGADE